MPRFATRNFPYSLRVDGTDGTVDFGDNFDKTQSEAFSISFWLKIHSLDNFDRVWTKRDGGNAGWDVQLLTAGRLRFTCEDINANGITEDANYKIGVWQHWVLTKGTGLTEEALTVYVDSEARDDGGLAGTLDSTLENSAVMKFGSTAIGGSIADISLTDCRVHNAELTQAQVNALYYDNDAVSVEGEWLMTEGSGTTLADSVGSVDGTITNEEWITDTPFKARSAISTARTAISQQRLAVRNIPYSINTVGSAGYINLGDNFDKDRTDAFSITGWTFVGSILGINQEIVSKRNGNFVGWEFTFNDFNNGLLMFQMEGDNGGILSVKSTAVFEDRNRWAWVGMTYDGSSDYTGVNLYVDGEPVAMTLGTNTLDDNVINSINCNIGAKTNNPDFTGMFTDIRIHNAELTAAQMADSYYKNIHASVEGEWDWATGSGTTLTATVGGVDGTLTSSPVWTADTPFKSRTDVS